MSPNVNTHLDTDICVVGGGPAGSTIALRLAQLGHRVVLLERSPFPRRYVGESLPPSILPLLDALNLRAVVESSGALRPQRALVRWRGGIEHVKTEAGEPGFLIDRGQFDLRLLQAAQAAGVEVIQPALALPPSFSAAEGWRVPVQQDGGVRKVRAAFLVDATGRRGLLPGNRRRCSPRTLALYAYWRHVPLPDAEPRVEAARAAWYWGAPLPGGVFNAMVFVAAGAFPQAGRRNAEAFYRTLLAESDLLRPCLDGILDSDVIVCDASSYYAEQPADMHSIRIGDAACTADPLSSQGVQKAMVSAVQASTVVHTIMTQPANSEAAVEFYCTGLRDTVTHLGQVTANFYAEHDTYRDEPFWRQRASAAHAPTNRPQQIADALPLTGGPRLRLSPETAIMDVPLIQGDVIVRAPAVHHPNLERPVAYLGGIHLATLLRDLASGQTTDEMLRAWVGKLPFTTGWAILNWLWSRQLLVPCQT